MKKKWPFPIAVAILSLPAQVFCQQASQLKLKDFQPVSIYNIPETFVPKARYPVIDLHTHDYLKSDDDVKNWVARMDSCGIEKVVILSYSTGKKFDSVMRRYAPYPGRFQVWCGFDYTGMDQPDWSKRAVAELERCYKAGARGVGELGDKGLGELYSNPTPGYGMHIDDPRMKPLLAKCAELHMPISIHVAEDAWMYLKDDSTNDGLMNAATWKVDLTKKGILGHDDLIQTLEHAVRDNPHTIFIACHLANSCADLAVLGKLLDRYPNLNADIGARYGEIASIPRFVKSFMEKYSNRLVYGTDMGNSVEMYRITFRILESPDEHFYLKDYFDYHWPLYGLNLSGEALKKIYHDNASRLLNQK